MLLSRMISSICGRTIYNPPPRLQHRKDQEWGAKVNLIFGDMRHVEVPEKADIMISELLGSFGDNELSPECLDGAMRFLKRTDSTRHFDEH